MTLKCKMCNGSGKTTALTFKGCPDCNKDGFNINIKKNCQCDGKGLIYLRIPNDCLTCGGNGKIEVGDKVKANL